MKVKRIIENLQEKYNPEEEVMIQWYAKEHLEFGDEKISDELWNTAVEIFENYEIPPEEFGVYDSLQQAEINLAKNESK